MLGNLTQEEREILKLITERYKNKKTAEDFCFNVKTVLPSIQALTAFTIEKGLVSCE